LVDEVMFDQRVYELVTRVYKDFTVDLLLQLRDLAHRVAVEGRRVGPFGILQSGRHDVLGHAVQLVRPLATAGLPPRGEPLVAPPSQQQGLGAQRLIGLDPGPFFEVLAPKLAEPAADPETLRTVRVLDDPIERDIRSDNNLSHFGVPLSPVLSLSRMRTPRHQGTGRARAAQFALRPVSISRSPSPCALPSPAAVRKGTADRCHHFAWCVVFKGKHHAEGMIMRVFVTGATGALGRHLVPGLVAAGHEVTATTRTPGKVAQ